MAIVNFKYYLHGDRPDPYFIARQVGMTADEIEALDIGRPFYEVALDCTLDTETGAVVIVGTSG